MRFVKTEDLRIGMRLARPIYNKNGVLLYDRNTNLTSAGIESIQRFGLIGMFVLEPAEPAPPMSEEDIEFERFQTMTVAQIQGELEKMLQTKKSSKISVIVANIMRGYGHLDHKINFIQSLRSKSDYIFKHSLNVAILCAMMCHKLNMKREEVDDVLVAAIVHDIGKLTAPKGILEKDELEPGDQFILDNAEKEGFSLIENVFSATPNIKRMCMQTQMILERYAMGEDVSTMKLVQGARILCVAEQYDVMTAMQFGGEPVSEVAAIRYLLENGAVFDRKVVNALVGSIQVLTAGVSVELSSGEHALVLSENPDDVLRPMLLCFTDNSIMDLANTFMYGDIEIIDVMRTMDSRYAMDVDAVRAQGIDVDNPVFDAVKGDGQGDASD